jgi:hypothetical protein
VTFEQEKAACVQRLSRGLLVKKQPPAELTAAAGAPALWFISPKAGLVFFDSRGIFVESEGELIAYEPKITERFAFAESGSETRERRLASISYEEAAHAIKLQLVTRVLPSGHDSHATLRLPLPDDVTPDHALKVAVEANRQAARAA